MDPSLWYLLGAILVIVGLAGTVLPVIPGALFVFGGLFFAAYAADFTRVGTTALVIIGIIGALTFVVDFVASIMGAKRVGASPQALVGATLGGIVGIFLGIPGIILGPFVGAVLGELTARGGLVQAGKVGLGTWLGLVVAAVLKVVMAFAMIATWGVSFLLSA
jgi:uncharacterized protein YqgC (DUF456 family)